MIPNLFIAINEDCNLDCSYCNVKKTKKKLTEKEVFQSLLYFIKFFPLATGYNVYFTWGEPLLSFREIVSGIYFMRKIEQKINKSFHIHIPTNGTLINEERAAFFQKHNITISLSIDSFDESYTERPLVWKHDKQSQSIIRWLLPIITKYETTFRVKIVVTPQHIDRIEGSLNEFYQLWFRFINIQPAHGVYWSTNEIDAYIAKLLFLRNNLDNYPWLESTTLKWSQSHTHTMKRCAKWVSEICIDSYGNILTCDAFLAYEPEIRKQFAFDNLGEGHFDTEKFRKGSDWKYCQNEVISDDTWGIERDLTHCETCNESISCTKLCNAVPINGEWLDKRILLSNFELFRKLDALK